MISVTVVTEQDRFWFKYLTSIRAKEHRLGKVIMEGKGCQKDADICHRTQVKWLKYPQYSINITAKELRFAKIYTKK